MLFSCYYSIVTHIQKGSKVYYKRANMSTIKKRLYILFFSLLLGFGLSLEVPRLIGRVNDYAKILSPQERQQLDDSLAGYEEQTSNQIAILTISSLAGDSLEDFSIRTAESWKLGQKNKNNGILILVVKNDRKIRIEVGYGLEPKITDAFSGQVIRQIITPAFRKGKYYQGLNDAVVALTEKIGTEFTSDRLSRPVYRVDQLSLAGANINENSMQSVLITLFIFGLLASGVKTHWAKKGFLGSVVLPLIIFMLLGVPFSLPLLLILLLFGWPFTFVAIVAMKILQLFMWGRGGILMGGAGSGGFGGFSGGGGSFGGGGSSGSW
jgi:uncharacterized protein